MCYDRQRNEILDRLYAVKGPVESIRLYLKHIYAMKHFSFGTWSSRQHVIAAVSAGGKTGFAECILSVNEPEASLKPWKKLLEDLAGLHVGEALKALREHQDIWPEQLMEMTEMALIDLCGKISGCPANALLGLNQGTPVCSVHVILSDNLEEVEESARWAKSQGKNQFIKVKLFGKTGLDCQVIQTVRKICPAEETFLIGDVNCGYRPEGEITPLPQIEEQMKDLHQAGLDACEDPAFLSRDEWVKLQSSVSPLELIPDYPMRPSRRSIKEICAGIGKL